MSFVGNIAEVNQTNVNLGVNLGANIDADSNNGAGGTTTQTLGQSIQQDGANLAVVLQSVDISDTSISF